MEWVLSPVWTTWPSRSPGSVSILSSSAKFTPPGLSPSPLAGRRRSEWPLHSMMGVWSLINYRPPPPSLPPSSLYTSTYFLFLFIFTARASFLYSYNFYFYIKPCNCWNIYEWRDDEFSLILILLFLLRFVEKLGWY